MPAPRLNKTDGPIGPLRDKRVVTIGTADFALDTGFICQVVTAGNLVYRTLEGTSDQTENSLTAGASINVAGVPVVLRAVRGSSTVTSIVIGVV